ncbi:unnamed protein product, partial [Staurois parvus]
WALVGGTGGHRWGTGGHRWVALLGAGVWHCWVALVGTAGHRWVHCWAKAGALLGTGGQHWWVALLGTDHQGTDHQCPDDLCDPCSDNCRFSAVLSSRSDSVRKVQPRTGNC